jgi:hypothetical protein
MAYWDEHERHRADFDREQRDYDAQGPARDARDRYNYRASSWRNDEPIGESRDLDRDVTHRRARYREDLARYRDDLDERERGGARASRYAQSWRDRDRDADFDSRDRVRRPVRWEAMDRNPQQGSLMPESWLAPSYPVYSASAWDRSPAAWRRPESETRGRFYGRGPRGYRRSDERIREDVNERLARHPDLDPSEVDVTVENGVVKLSGIVEDRREKRLVEDIIEDIMGIDDIDNHLKVRRGFLAAMTGERASVEELARADARAATGQGDAEQAGAHRVF